MFGRGFSSVLLQRRGGDLFRRRGCRLSHVVREAFSHGRAGFEFAVGTPGTVGGALRMNAGTSREYIGSRV